MPIQLESREHLPGVQLLHHNQDEVVAYTGESYLRNLPYLIDAATIFAQRNLGWTEVTARAILTRGLGVEHLTRGLELNDQTIPLILGDINRSRKIPSVMFFKEEGAKVGEYAGIACQRMFFPQTEEYPESGRLLGEEVPTMYQILRAVEQGERGRNRARSSIELALWLHGGISRWFFHRSGNFIAIYTNTRSTSFNQEYSYPHRLRFNQDPFAKELMRKGFNLVKLNGQEIDDNGVSRNDYIEPNLGIENLRPGSKEEIVRVHTMLTEEFKLGPLDALYSLYKVK